MVNVWIALTLVVAGAVCLATGLAQHMAGLFVLGFAFMAVAAIFGTRGRIPHDEAHH